MFLVQAFNSIPFFAWSERVFFKAPYHVGQVAVQATCPAGFTLALGGAGRLGAAMAGGALRRGGGARVSFRGAIGFRLPTDPVRV